MAKYDMMVWYSEDMYGRAWTTIEADSEEEARAKLDKAFQEGGEYKLEWEYDAKGGRGSRFDLETKILCEKRKETN